MKKPAGIYLVAVWLFLQQTFFVRIPLTALFRIGGLSMEHYATTRGLCTIFFFFVLVGLVQLAPAARWAAVGLFSIATIMEGISFLYVLYPGFKDAGPAGILVPVFMAGNIYCIYHLGRPKFGRFCRELRNRTGVREIDEIDAAFSKNKLGS